MARRAGSSCPVHFLGSPWNQSGEGYWEYRARRRKLTRQNVHLVELDLLVRGQRLPMEQELPPADFYVFLSRGDRRPQCDVFAWSVRQPLPRNPIPLRRPIPMSCSICRPFLPSATSGDDTLVPSTIPRRWTSR